MAHLLFLDESGQDHRESPYEVLGGLAIEDSRIWALITDIRDAEVEHFGLRISRDELEIKGKKLLKAKTFRLAAQLAPFDASNRTALARQAIAEGVAARSEARVSRHTRQQLTALAQAKLAFCGKVIELCARHQARAFASIVSPTAEVPRGAELRKDYADLFERFFAFLGDVSPTSHGLVVFDEMEKAQSHLLVNQMAEYFVGTEKGRLRASRILPEPMFVHSDLTSVVQLADLVVCVVSWAVRLEGMASPARAELSGLAEAVLQLRYRSADDAALGLRGGWSFLFLDDLRARSKDTATAKEKRQ